MTKHKKNTAGDDDDAFDIVVSTSDPLDLDSKKEEETEGWGEKEKGPTMMIAYSNYYHCNYATISNDCVLKLLSLQLCHYIE